MEYYQYNNDLILILDIVVVVVVVLMLLVNNYVCFCLLFLLFVIVVLLCGHTVSTALSVLLSTRVYPFSEVQDKDAFLGDMRVCSGQVFKELL